MRRTLFVIALLALTAGLHAQVQGGPKSYRYRWHDATGLPHYSDSLTSEAMKYGYDLVDQRGILVQHVDRQMTPEERAAAQKQADEAAAQQRVIQDRARADSQMLAAYPNEEAYVAAQKLNLDHLDGQISTTRLNLHSQEKALTDLLTRAGDLERAKQPVPKVLSDGVATQRDVVAKQRKTLEREQQSRDAMEQKNAQDLQHYRDAKAAAEKSR